MAICCPSYFPNGTKRSSAWQRRQQEHYSSSKSKRTYSLQDLILLPFRWVCHDVTCAARTQRATDSISGYPLFHALLVVEVVAIYAGIERREYPWVRFRVFTGLIPHGNSRPRELTTGWYRSKPKPSSPSNLCQVGLPAFNPHRLLFELFATFSWKPEEAAGDDLKRGIQSIHMIFIDLLPLVLCLC